jgi:hypothetical protein
MEILPEIWEDILGRILSEDRAKLCSVSRFFEQLCIGVSRRLAIIPELYDGRILIKFKFAKAVIFSGDYHGIVRNKNTFLLNLPLACESGHLGIVNLSLKYNSNENVLDYGLYGACKGGWYDILMLLIANGANDWNFALSGACKSGNIAIVDKLIELGADDWNWGFYYASKKGQLDVVMRLMEKGATAWNRGLSGACQGKHKNIVRLMIQCGANQCDCYAPILDHLL